MRVHADILKLAKTREQREAIKWFHARSIFFGRSSKDAVSEGFSLIRQCDHQDARFVLSLFPGDGPGSESQAQAVFLAQKDEPRCLCWAASAGAEGTHWLWKRSAELGYAWGQAIYGGRCEDRNEVVAWLEKAVAQGEVSAMNALAEQLVQGASWDPDVECNYRSNARELWRQGALLGDAVCQMCVANIYETTSVEHAVWARRSAIQGLWMGMEGVCRMAKDAIKLYNSGEVEGRRVFEIGAALEWSDKWFDACRRNWVVACRESITLFKQWRGEAEVAVLCWIWLARQLGVAKDIRLLIASLIWDEKAAWSEKKKTKKKRQGKGH